MNVVIKVTKNKKENNHNVVIMLRKRISEWEQPEEIILAHGEMAAWQAVNLAYTANNFELDFMFTGGNLGDFEIVSNWFEGVGAVLGVMKNNGVKLNF